MRQLFVTGMLRSGTSLIQVLLTNHPQLFVAYQPFYQLYVDVRQRFLDDYALTKTLPLGDGMDGGEEERSLFKQWLKERRFDTAETDELVNRSTMARGGGASNWKITTPVRPGTFLDIRNQLHESLAEHFMQVPLSYVGAKEILCEEYIPYLIDGSVRCLIIVRDPRAMIASACHGRYQKEVGDRYPLLMLIRMWRKSAAYWLAYHSNHLIHTIRYEELIRYPGNILHEVATWLGIDPFPEGLLHQPLRDHAGKVWKGNSSFGDKTGVQSPDEEVWRTLLSPEEIRFIEACTLPEMRMLGYAVSCDLQRDDISDFQEDTSGVRESYLSIYHLDEVNRNLELQRWDKAQLRQYENTEDNQLFLFPDVFSTSVLRGSKIGA